MSKMISMGQSDPGTIMHHVKDRGFISMLEVARSEVLEGVTDVEEVYRVASCVYDM